MFIKTYGCTIVLLKSFYLNKLSTDDVNENRNYENKPSQPALDVVTSCSTARQEETDTDDVNENRNYENKPSQPALDVVTSCSTARQLDRKRQIVRSRAEMSCLDVVLTGSM